MMTPKEKALKLPQSPGVYIMLDKNKEVIYVGKAKKLYNRVNSYFRTNSSHSAKTRRMVSQIKNFDYIITDTEFEALVLENSLIKRHMPKYNILLKDDKGYPSIRLSVKDEYPGFSIVSKPQTDGAEYFGPYGGRVESRRAIETVCELLKLPSCKRKFPADIGKGRPCLNKHIGRCDALCAGGISKEEYNERIRRACMILSGKTGEVKALLEEKMLCAAENLEFELAGKYRDEIRAIESLRTKQKVMSAMMSDTDIFALYTGENKTAFSILHYIDGNLIESETKITDTPVYADLPELLEEFVVRYYSERTRLPREIYLQYELSSPEQVESWLSELSGHRVNIYTPKRGEKLKSVQMAAKNAEEKALAEINKEEREKRILEDLRKILSLDCLPRRIEAYDISNTSGKEMVAGMVVFQNGSPRRSEYRKFRIKTLNNQDDPRAMREVLERRFVRYKDGDEMFLNKPDLILLDGGITQTRAVTALFCEMGITIPVFGMVKNEKHQTRTVVTAEGKEIEISANPAVFRFVSSLQEEVHRFSVEYHRKLRAKNVTASELTKIEGVGKKRAEELLSEFRSLAAIKKATVSELSAILPDSVAGKVYNYFHETEKKL
ncbi:MAG: excinuclease ABC subunit UvrC [Oscillospiraceae bacterium]|nr:excinuclease ABC subunit UvrC [Oscillospiraceae bacterium]